jgi:magnesium chelatase family protein
MLIAAYNPCPCGWAGVEGHACVCEDGARRRYQARLSGPMRDRIDLAVTLLPASTPELPAAPEPSRGVRQRVAAAWREQRERQGMANAHLPPAQFDVARGFDDTSLRHLDLRGRQMGLSLRRVHRVARVARTIADLARSGPVRAEHVDEALCHRPVEVAA